MKIQYKLLIDKLDSFIRKYYKNQIIRGVLLSVSIYLFFYLSVSVSEYYAYFSIPIRTIIFYACLSLFLIVFIKFILIPALQFYKIGKIISHGQAAKILSQHFTELQDKLQNTLELANSKDDLVSYELIIASIDQRVAQIKPIPFLKAINFKENYKYLKYFVLLFIVFMLLFIFSPNVFTEGTGRIVNYRTYFEPARPFQFILLNDSLYVQKGGDFEVNISCQGIYVPENVSICYGGNEFTMKKISNSKFQYNFKNINNTINFYFSAENYSSGKYRLNVLPAPIIINFNVFIDVPEYTQETDKILQNVGDITIPYGSKVKWNFITKDIDTLYFTYNDTSKNYAIKDTSGFSISKTFYKSSQYKITILNKFFKRNDIVKYSVNVVPDLYPDIKVTYIRDTVKHSLFYYKGIIQDDYGFNKLTFNYKVVENTDSVTSVSIPINKNITSEEFYFAYDFSEIGNTGNKIEYYFEIWDNDAIQGSKSSRTNIYEYNIPSEEELEKLTDEANANIQSKLMESLKLVNELKNDINSLREKVINDNLSSWEKTKMIEQIISKQNHLQALMSEISKQNKQKNDLINSFSDEQSELLEKQLQIEELLDNLLSDELKQLIDEFNELMDDFDKNKLNDLYEDLKLSYDDISDQLDRDLELLKQYEIEQKLEKTISQLQELAEEQKTLSEEVKDKDENKENLTQEQKQQKDEFNKLSEDYKNIQKLNENLKKPFNMNDFQEEINQIKEGFNEGEENMNQNKMGKASKSQKQTSGQLSELSSAMQDMMEQNMASQMLENMDALRQILDNLVTFSFSQEEQIIALKSIRIKDPKYNEIINKQKRLSDEYIVIKDSLNALAKRTPQLSSVISKELLSIEKNLNKALSSLDERRTNKAKMFQQYIMTSANNLALLLSEVLSAMQMQFAGQCSGNQQCQKPGAGMPSLSQLRNMQQSLKSQLESMIEQMKSGKGKLNPNALNKMLAQMLAQQEIFNKMMGDLMNNSSLHPETLKELNDIKKMIEKTENDIINKNVTPVTLKRQNMIITRLLEAENSEYQREIDKKRESKEIKNDFFRNPKEIFEYKGIGTQFSDLLNTSNIKLYNYYKKKYKEYLINLNQ